MIEALLSNSPLYFLITARIFAFLSLVPIFSSPSIPTLVRIALAGTVSVLLFASAEYYPIPDNGLGFLLLLAGEVLLGIVAGFFVRMIFSVFLIIGGYLSLPMGFSASQVFDPLAQVEIPLVGQFINLLALMIFLVSDSLHEIFYVSIMGSFSAIRAIDISRHLEDIISFLLKGLGSLFVYSLSFAFPFIIVLFIISISLGLLAKAAPQMNLLILGFPISISITFLLFFLFIPLLFESVLVLIEWMIHQTATFFQNEAV